jgi:hypothetical protein
MQKALFFDIDGTLVSEKSGVVPMTAIEALRCAKAHGHLLFINTGRTRASLPQLLFPLPFDGYLCGCGTNLFVNGSSIYHQRIDSQMVSLLIEDFKRYGCDAILEGTESVYFPEYTSRFPELERIRNQYISLKIAKTYPVDDISADKFVFFSDEANRVKPFLNKLQILYNIIDRRNGFYEIVPKGHSKATAIHMILKQYNISPQNAYVFGDSSNDLPMFTAVSNTIAMGHHDPVLTPYATFVTKAVEDDGILFALEELELI